MHNDYVLFANLSREIIRMQKYENELNLVQTKKDKSRLC
jgi:hypothetical protein